MTKAASQVPNFGDLGTYVQGGGVPEGDYALEFNVQMYQGTNRDGTPSKIPARLGVMITFHSLTDAEKRGENAYTKFVSMGSEADKSWMPDPDTGKSIVPVPDGPGAGLQNSTNWALFLKSFYECGLPVGVFTNDISVLDGVHVHLANYPEPEERKSFQKSKTAEGGEDERRGSGTISVITEIKEDGKPWEGTGGIPDATAKAPAKGKAPVKAAAKPNGKVAPAPAASDAGEEDITTAAITGLSAVLENNAKGCPVLVLRTSAFAAIKKEQGQDMASAVKSEVFDKADVFSGLLGLLGYAIKGIQVVPAS